MFYDRLNATTPSQNRLKMQSSTLHVPWRRNISSKPRRGVVLSLVILHMPWQDGEIDEKRVSQSKKGLNDLLQLAKVHRTLRTRGWPEGTSGIGPCSGKGQESRRTRRLQAPSWCCSWKQKHRLVFVHTSSWVEKKWWGAPKQSHLHLKPMEIQKEERKKTMVISATGT